MFRNRDIIALVLLVILSRMAWNDGTESLSASADLAFFFPRDRITVVSPMDVDGDGTNEAMAIAKAVPNNSESFQLQIMDLKPLHTFGKRHLAPFRPKVIFTSKEINEQNAYPVHMTSGQVLIKRHPRSNDPKAKRKPPLLPDNVELNDRNRHYFCGTDWHDASSKCGTPCPNGQASECPNDERCFADTPCDALGEMDRDGKASAETTQVMFELTPGGGLPSLVTLWSNGLVTLHSLTNEKSKRKIKQLELRELWRQSLFSSDNMDTSSLIWEEINILFLDSYSSIEAHAEHGMVIISGSYFMDKDDGDVEEGRVTLTVALDAYTGKPLWQSHSDLPDKEEEPQLLPITRGQTSFARRRSNIARVMQAKSTSNTSAAALPNCISLLKRHIKEVLPYSYWGPRDSGLAAIHLNHKKKSKDSQNHHASKPHEERPLAPAKKKWHHRFPKPRLSRNMRDQPIQGKPNALVSQTKGGIQIRSLKNGKAVCHLSLLEETLYSDFNNDGTLDQLQVLLHSKTNRPNDKFVWNLVGRLQQDQKELKKKGASKKRLMEQQPNLCHALVTSGIPSREEIFSAPICGTAHERAGSNPIKGLDTVNPLVVESLNGRRNTRDVIVALNNGMVHRLHGTSGRKEWALAGRHHENFPTWEEGSSHNALLTRVQSSLVPPPIRPILLAGENSLAVLSVKSGAVLATAVFPQISMAKPILADVSGDGSTDVIVLTEEGIWGFQISIRPGSPVTLRILVGLLLMALMLGVIKNRSGRTDKRSTDE
ncbi:hypothetical protein IV203_036326 [Nitzschia inconspicua]|uniref:FG-GAP repeat-containing protein n=1 Tax=Nitzschia inconspicua TaxID=303405 RepID=A0A9K3PVR7_9STRA|nr:hypothetical protein IV203_036326 [Nitzschia inconspicua]